MAQDADKDLREKVNDLRRSLEGLLGPLRTPWRTEIEDVRYKLGFETPKQYLELVSTLLGLPADLANTALKDIADLPQFRVTTDVKSKGKIETCLSLLGDVTNEVSGEIPPAVMEMHREHVAEATKFRDTIFAIILAAAKLAKYVG